MVHALEQAHRVLTAHGTLIDLHPDRGPLVGRRRIPLIVRGRREVLDARNVVLTAGADRAVTRVVRRGLFTLESGEVFSFMDHLRSLPVLERLLDVEWTETTLGAVTRRRLQGLLRADPSAEIVVVEAVRLNILRKI